MVDDIMKSESITNMKAFAQVCIGSARLPYPAPMSMPYLVWEGIFKIAHSVSNHLSFDMHAVGVKGMVTPTEQALI